MLSEIFARYLHFLGIFALSATMVTQNILLKPKINQQTLQKLVKIDLVYGLSAIASLTAGLLLWLAVGKSSEFYSTNPIFHAKLTLFFIVAGLSIPPTIFLLKHRKSSDTLITVPKHIRILKHSEMLFLFVLPLLATLISRGVGLN